MNRHLIKKEKEFEWDKIIYKEYSEELRVIKDKVWKITNYTLLSYVAIFTIINIIADKKLIIDLTYGIYFAIFLISSCSIKIVSRLYVDIIMFKSSLKRIQAKYKLFNYFPIIDRSLRSEEVLIIFYILTGSFGIILIYVSSYYKMSLLCFMFIFIIYTIYEIILIIDRRKTLKDFTGIDIVTDIIVISGLIVAYVGTNFEIIKFFKELLKKVP